MRKNKADWSALNRDIVTLGTDLVGKDPTLLPILHLVRTGHGVGMDVLYEAKDEPDVLAYMIRLSIHSPAPMLLKDNSQSLVHFQHKVCPPILPGLTDAHSLIWAFDATRHEPVNVGIHLTIGRFVETFTSSGDYSERISTIP
ncbi:uncharacterized protein LACBIDRAFT_321609 [Laccaria bicolor S238N-H82]|uniref:Predicted protein n=1 Tax=Laccaria bicolor (strain S238N-H82 / ATCC MYA-4686) TaxID=486041 RepID=B0CTI9_LACBS|nr:uncharacterized protein LACBIDRAFT_321609 [Laccaria bicolor S238N-H82]EDR13932.1 predicted protein [Laccaria bicolor S238N-H82]|eukprot:XP_001874491.1 predicted protein [Laccaria bicolor S238N-H82]